MNNPLRTPPFNPLKLVLLFIEVLYFTVSLCFAPENHFRHISTRFCFSFLSCLLSDFHHCTGAVGSNRRQNLLASLKILSLLSQIRYLEEIDWYDPLLIDKEALVLDLAFEGLLRISLLNLLSTTYLIKLLHLLSSGHIFCILAISAQANQNLIIRVILQGLLFCLPLFLSHKARKQPKEATQKDLSNPRREEVMRNVLDNICEGVILLDKEGEVKFVNNYLESPENKLTLEKLSTQFSYFELNDFIPANHVKCPSINQIGKFDLSSSRFSFSHIPKPIDSSFSSNEVSNLIDVFNLYMKPSSELSAETDASSRKFRPIFKAKFRRSQENQGRDVELGTRVIQGGEEHGDKQLLILVKDTTQYDFKSLLIEKEKNTYQENFVSSLSHELRTPLNANLAFLEQAMDSNLTHSDIKEKLIKPAFVSAKLLFYIVSDVIDYSMILANTLKLDIRSKSLISTVHECFDIFQAKAVEKGIKLNLTIQGEIPTKFYTDHKRVLQVLVNLLKNSFRFTTKGTIEVILKRSSNQNVLIVVRDTGIGIARRTQEKLQDSLNTEKLRDKVHENSAGIGFGLFLSNKLAKLLNNGSYGLDFYSELESGSKFFFEVQNFASQTQNKLHSPLKKHEEESNLAESVFRYTTRGLKNCFNHQPKPRVLVVDDEVFNIIVIENFCKSLGISAERALNGEEALMKLKACSNDGKTPIKAIFIDINMPVKDGYQATKEIQQMINKREIERIPIIGVTAYGSKEKVEKGYKSGMVEVLIKPLSKEMILGALSHYKVIELKISL